MRFTLVRNGVGPGAGRESAVLPPAAASAIGGAVVTTAEDRALEDLLERLRSRFYGKYRGIVSDVDPATCRIKAKVPAVLGDDRDRLVHAVRALRRPQRRASRSCPRCGSGVWIEFEGGDVSFPIWVGGYWREGEVPADVGAAREGDRHQGVHPSSSSTTTRAR